MDEYTWKNVKEIFTAALEIDANERSAFVDNACGPGSSLGAEVLSLLASHSGADNFIEDPAFNIGEFLVEKGGHSGKRFGNYKIIKEIGSGGMGAVFLAERSDGEFSQQVAIKIIRQAIAENDLIKRFKTERQILASLNHPNIAKLLDGGVTGDEVPFLAMEYVEGRPITNFASENRISVTERLKLFMKICSAVAFAHRNLIVHRDLKPSNILVTNNGEPKLLDFGLAKLLAEDFSNDPGQTLTAFRALTPAYASPEQLRNEIITTAADIYSLGVLLYELLTGERPFNFGGKRLEDIIKTVSEHSPQPPSSVPNSILKPARLKGDLDNIAMMALRREPEHRYQTVEAFAGDIQRYLDGQPVSARPLTIRYRVSKFVWRNKASVFACSLILLSIIGGSMATLWQSRAAEREKQKALRINTFLEDTLKYSNPVLSSLDRKGRETTVSEVLDESARRVDSGEFDNFPEIKAELIRTISNSYFGQGKYSAARTYMAQYVELIRSIYGENHPKTAVASIYWSGLLFAKGEFQESELTYRKYMPALRSDYANGAVTAETLADALNNFAYLRRTQGDSSEAESLFRETLELMTRLSGESLNAVSTTRSTLASTIADQGRFEEAKATAREAVEELQRRGDTNSPRFGFSLTIYGGLLVENGEVAEADTNLQQAELIFRQLLSPSNLWLADNLRNQASSLYIQGRFPEAIVKADECLLSYEQNFGKYYDQYPTALIVKGLSTARLGKQADGEKMLREALEIRLSSLPSQHYWVALAKSALGDCLMMEKEFVEAGPLLTESYEILNQYQGPENPRTLLAKRRLDDFHRSDRR